MVSTHLGSNWLEPCCFIYLQEIFLHFSDNIDQKVMPDNCKIIIKATVGSPLIDEEHPCAGKSGSIIGISQFTDSGVVNKASDEQHEA